MPSGEYRGSVRSYLLGTLVLRDDDGDEDGDEDHEEEREDWTMRMVRIIW